MNCLSHYFNVAAAILTTAGAGGLLAVSLLPPFTVTPAFLALIIAVLAGIAWYIAALIALVDCLEDDPVGNKEELEKIKKELDELKETKKNIEKRLKEVEDKLKELGGF